MIYTILIKIAFAYCCLTDIMEIKSKKTVFQQVTTLSEQSSSANISQSQPQQPCNTQQQPIGDSIGLQALVRRRANNNS